MLLLLVRLDHARKLGDLSLEKLFFARGSHRDCTSNLAVKS